MRYPNQARCYSGSVQGFSRISIDPKVMGGRPCIRGMRMTVGMIVEALPPADPKATYSAISLTWKSKIVGRLVHTWLRRRGGAV